MMGVATISKSIKGMAAITQCNRSFIMYLCLQEPINKDTSSSPMDSWRFFL
jgi:hypothetical protein